MSRELLQNVRVLDPVSESDRIADILIAEGNIKAVEEKIAEFPADTEVRDCQGLILGPGLTDIYSHSGEPGFEDRETLESLIRLRRLAVLRGWRFCRIPRRLLTIWPV